MIVNANIFGSKVFKTCEFKYIWNNKKWTNMNLNIFSLNKNSKYKYIYIRTKVCNYK